MCECTFYFQIDVIKLAGSKSDRRRRRRRHFKLVECLQRGEERERERVLCWDEWHKIERLKLLELQLV